MAHLRFLRKVWTRLYLLGRTLPRSWCGLPLKEQALRVRLGTGLANLAWSCRRRRLTPCSFLFAQLCLSWSFRWKSSQAFAGLVQWAHLEELGSSWCSLVWRRSWAGCGWCPPRPSGRRARACWERAQWICWRRGAVWRWGSRAGLWSCTPHGRTWASGCLLILTWPWSGPAWCRWVLP